LNKFATGYEPNGTIIEIAQDSLIVLLKLSLPLLLVALVVGVLISLVQALTQIQEPTISFVPKIIAVFFSLLLSLNLTNILLESLSLLL
jgi:flagellar biosynthetic protein FliQ